MNRSNVSLVAAAAVVIAGCQSGAPTGAPSEGAGKSTHRFKVGVSIPAADHGWNAGMKYWTDQATKANPDIDWTVQDFKNSDEQISSLENLSLIHI